MLYPDNITFNYACYYTDIRRRDDIFLVIFLDSNKRMNEDVIYDTLKTTFCALIKTKKDERC